MKSLFLPKYEQKIVRISALYSEQPGSEGINSFWSVLTENNYSKNAILIFDDIHWSPKMTKAWKEIIVDPKVLLSVDLFKLGIVIVGADASSNHNKHHQLFLSF